MILVPPLSVPRQLGLPFEHGSSFAPADFVQDGSNTLALTWLDDPARWPDRRLALWGGKGCGKTHLLHLWADRVGAVMADGPALSELAPGVMALALDNADAAPEHALLHTLNQAVARGRLVVLAAREPPARWPVRLPDLASRLRATAAVAIEPAEDSLLRALLARQLSDRQLAVPAQLRDWLLLRLPRTPAAVREIAARLDRAQLAQGTGVTRGLLAELMTGMEEPGAG